MANKQPFYHLVEYQFTATNALDEKDLKAVTQAIKKLPGVIKSSVILDSVDAEPGDPADLM